MAVIVNRVNGLTKLSVALQSQLCSSSKCLHKMSFSGDTRQFEDAQHSEIYSLYRPQPPPSIVKHILTFMGETKTRSPMVALDVGCGSGR